MKAMLSIIAVLMLGLTAAPAQDTTIAYGTDIDSGDNTGQQFVFAIKKSLSGPYRCMLSAT